MCGRAAMPFRVTGMGAYVAFDLGGTNLRVAVSLDGRKLDSVQSTPTPASFDIGIATLETMVKQLLGNEKPVALVGGIGWALDKSRSHIFRSTKTNLMDWNDKPLREELEKRFSTSVQLENDCMLAALGEASIGAGKGSPIMAYITVSTGVNGARIVQGALDRVTYGFEIGKQVITQGRLEDLISGTAVQKKYGVHPRELADPQARNDLADLLAEGLYNTTLHWSPDRIVLGGSMIIGVNPIPLERVAKTLSDILNIYPEVPEIKMASLGDNGVLEGARMLAKTLA